LKIYILQGSVATQLKCSGIFSNHFDDFITNFPQNAPAKLWTSVNIWRRYDKRLWFTFWVNGPHYVWIETANQRVSGRYVHSIQAVVGR